MRSQAITPTNSVRNLRSIPNTITQTCLTIRISVEAHVRLADWYWRDIFNIIYIISYKLKTFICPHSQKVSEPVYLIPGARKSDQYVASRGVDIYIRASL